MNEVSIAYINALLADASYRTVTGGMTIEQLAGELESRMTTTQASYIATNFEVLNSEISPTGGFDAVIWRGKPNSDYAGQIFVSMRGTQGGTDIADDIALAASGVPINQVVDMVTQTPRRCAR